MTCSHKRALSSSLIWLCCITAGSHACTLDAPSEWTLPDYDPEQYQATLSTKILQVRAQYPNTCQARLMIEMQNGQAPQLHSDQQPPLNFELSSQANYNAPLSLAPNYAAQIQLTPASAGVNATQALPLWIRVPRSMGQSRHLSTTHAAQSCRFHGQNNHRKNADALAARATSSQFAI